MRFNSQEDSITKLIIAVDMVRIVITLLPFMHFFTPLFYCLHFLFHFLDSFCSHQDPILKPIQTQRCLIQSPINKRERRHLYGALVIVVIREFHQWQEFFPMILLVHHVHVQHVLQGLVCLFGLPISLQVIHRTEVKLGSQGLMETRPKSSSKHQCTIGYNPLRYAIQHHNLTDENYSYVRCVICCTHINKVITLHQSIY
jgi:hypothetical protein